MSDTAEAIVVPGTRLCAAREAVGGHGTYERNGSIFASLVGRKVTDTDESGRERVSVVGRTGISSAAAPQIGAVVMARVTKITTKAATASIVCVDGVPLAEPFVGIIRFAFHLCFVLCTG